LGVIVDDARDDVGEIAVRLDVEEFEGDCQEFRARLSG